MRREDATARIEMEAAGTETLGEGMASAPSGTTKE